MEVQVHCGNRRKFMSLLLCADPSEDMVGQYLEQGIFLVAKQGEQVVGVACVVPAEKMSGGGWELKNISVDPCFQRQGVGSALIGKARTLLPKGTIFWVGTADASNAALRFYGSNGFVVDHTVPEFFTKNYPEPVYDEGVLCRDMVYLCRRC